MERVEERNQFAQLLPDCVTAANPPKETGAEPLVS